ncbi:pilus assembly protein PilN [Ventosimonas gracilis]|uniref:Pilus assembly protein PilN n=1 Tax=Ventosimonas gracilis TaxID=1680762 RepID=A0A139SSL8_9GAMM|nr:PilN domain-containing protein [Ventosimonas gracilis]KXU37557.1 pilus assembly protein PilN [Ventosimonas gracilis]
MARINLLPWREERNEERKKQFVVVLFGTLVIAGGLVFLGNQFVSGLLDNQSARNSYLRKEITSLDERIKQVQEIREMRTQLLGRMQVIQDLQSNRQVMPRLFDQLVRTLPDGVYYSSLAMQGQRISIDGFAESNNRVSALMRNLEASPWLAGATLSGVKAIENAHLDGQANQFQLTVRQSRPKAGEVQGASQ